MGTTTSRDDSTTRQKYQQKLSSLKKSNCHSTNCSSIKSNNSKNYHDYKTMISSKTSNNQQDDSTNSQISCTTTAGSSEDIYKDNNTVPTIKMNPVNLIKHQMVLSDHVSPISSLSAVISSIPVRRSSWRKSINTSTTKTTNDNISFTSGSFFDLDEEEDNESPTSVGSEGHSPTLKKPTVMMEEKKNNNRKKQSSLTSLKNGVRRGGTKDIAFESKYNNSVSPTPRLPRPLWTHTIHDEREYDRQLRQHYVLKYVLGGNIHVPVTTDKPITILDIACGGGFWTLDIAQTYPNAQVIGLDAFPAYDKRMYSSTGNIVYKYGDLTSHLPLPDNSIDIIFQRHTTSTMPHENWSFLLNELWRTAKPGGYLELVKYDCNILDSGPALALINEWFKIVSSAMGVDHKQSQHLTRMIVSAGFEDVEKNVIRVPIGEWPADEDEKEKGFLYKEVIKSMFKAMKQWWRTELGVSEQEYDKVINAAMDEFEEQCFSVDWVIYTAKKPPAASLSTASTTNVTTATTPSTTTISFDL